MKRAAIAAVAIASTLSACGAAQGGQDADSEAGLTGVGQVRAGSVAPLAQCADWNAGTEAEQQATITDIRAQVNQAGADGPTPDLSDKDAREMFDRACAQGYASGFRLYKLYLRAASFAPLTP